jgi:hypothetical protein
LPPPPAGVAPSGGGSPAQCQVNGIDGVPIASRMSFLSFAPLIFAASTEMVIGRSRSCWLMLERIVLTAAWLTVNRGVSAFLSRARWT